MNRRNLIIASGVVALAPPLALAPSASLAQTPAKMRRIGVLWETRYAINRPRFDAFKAGLAALGYTEGRDYRVDQREADADFARLPALAAELAAGQPDLIVASGTPSALALRGVTREIPILFAVVGDPVGSGLAASLARPGGNLTGLANLSSELVAKRLDLLRQLAPGMRRAGLLFDPSNPNDQLSLTLFEAACRTLRLQPVHAAARDAAGLEAAFRQLVRGKAQGLLALSTGSINAARERITGFLAQQRLPAIAGTLTWVEAGCLAAYGPDSDDLYRRAAAYADKIFNGAKPGELPIQQPVKFDFVVNLKTAKALRLKMSEAILIQATKVIE